MGENGTMPHPPWVKTLSAIPTTCLERDSPGWSPACIYLDRGVDETQIDNRFRSSISHATCAECLRSVCPGNTTSATDARLLSGTRRPGAQHFCAALLPGGEYPSPSRGDQRPKRRRLVRLLECGTDSHTPSAGGHRQGAASTPSIILSIFAFPSTPDLDIQLIHFPIGWCVLETIPNALGIIRSGTAMRVTVPQE